MIELLRVVKDELSNKPYKFHDQLMIARSEISPLPKKPLTKAHAQFYTGFKAVKADESKINVVYCKLQISFLIGRGLAASFTPKVKVLPIRDGQLTTTSLVPSVPSTARHFLKSL